MWRARPRPSANIVAENPWGSNSPAVDSLDCNPTSAAALQGDQPGGEARSRNRSRLAAHFVPPYRQCIALRSDPANGCREAIRRVAADAGKARRAARARCRACLPHCQLKMPEPMSVAKPMDSIGLLNATYAVPSTSSVPRPASSRGMGVLMASVAAEGERQREQREQTDRALAWACGLTTVVIPINATAAQPVTRRCMPAAPTPRQATAACVRARVAGSALGAGAGRRPRPSARCASSSATACSNWRSTSTGIVTKVSGS